MSDYDFFSLVGKEKRKSNGCEKKRDRKKKENTALNLYFITFAIISYLWI